MVNEKGYVWATGAGTATITLTVKDSAGAAKTASTTVKVTTKAIDLALNKTRATIVMTKDADNTLQLTAYDARTGEDVKVAWKSSDKSIATVANGVVTAKKAGKAVITVKAKDGSKKSVRITVTVKAKK